MPSGSVAPEALFVGLCTLDVIQLVDHVPGGNEKVAAHRQTVAAGGPATNAAATFAHLGGTATLVTGVGCHPLAAGIRADLVECGIRLVDLAPSRTTAPSVSSILVTEASGTRAVASTNAIADRLVPPDQLDDLVRGVAVVQVDGHHPDLATSALRRARAIGRMTVLDAGSWKPGTAQLLPLLDVVACSSDFHPPGVLSVGQTAEYLRSCGVPWIVITQGNEPVRWWGPTGRAGEVPVPVVAVVDTLGAGDVFHGALTFGLAAGARSGTGGATLAESLDAEGFVRAVTRAVLVATTACASFGTRGWMRPAAP